MDGTLLFGEKENFAIELGFTNKPKKYKLGFWIKGKRLGSFTKSGELKYFSRAYYEFINRKDTQYLQIFDNFSPKEIDFYLIGFFFTNECKRMSEEELNKREKFHIFFGDQFANQTGNFHLLYHNNNVIFIIKRPMDGPVDRYEILFEDFCRVFDEYIEYVTANNLV